MTYLEKILVPLGLSFPVPSQEAMRANLSDREIALLNLAASNAVVKATGPTSPVDTHHAVGDILLVIAPKNSRGRVVSVINNGPNEVLISPSGVPVFADGGDEQFSRGILLYPDDMWESPEAITTQVRAIARPGESTAVTVTQYLPCPC